MVSGITVVSTVAAVDLGTIFINTDNRSFDQITLSEPGVIVGNQLTALAGVNAAASGNTSPGVEATNTLPSINTALVSSSYSYKFEVKEARADSFQAGDNFKIEVFKNAALIGTLYMRQDSVDDASVEGVTVEVDLGPSSSGEMTTTVTPVLGATFTQQDYRWYTNANSVNPGAALAVENSIFTSAVDGTPYHLRMGVEAVDANEAAGRRFKLQVSTFTSGPWTDLGVLGSTEVWRGYDNSIPVDGAALPGILLSNSFNNSRQTYEETNNATTVATRSKGGRVWLDNWTIAGPATVTTADSPHAGTYHLNVDKGSDAKRSTDLSGQSSMRLQFWVKTDGHKGNSQSYAEVSSDGTNWNVVATWDKNPTLVYACVDIDLSPYTMSSQFWVRFRTDAGGQSTMWGDDVEITQ